MICKKSGIYLEGNRLDGLRTAIHARMASNGFVDPSRYYSFMRFHPEGQKELSELLSHITINETYFFRNTAHFKALRDYVLAEMIGKSNQDIIRIWSAGCSTGEEPYSIAMTVLDLMQDREGLKIEILATDVSVESLKLARLNAERHGVSDCIEFRQGDLWEPVEDQGRAFDIILSNPPYVASEEYNKLIPEVRDYEPRLALDGKKAGMYFIEKIIMRGLDFLKSGGWIMLEMAPEQTEKALGLMGNINGYEEKTRIKDYSNRYRVVVAQKGLK